MLQSVNLRVAFSKVGHFDGCLVTNSHQKVGGLWGTQASKDKDMGF